MMGPFQAIPDTGRDPSGDVLAERYGPSWRRVYWVIRRSMESYNTKVERLAVSSYACPPTHFLNEARHAALRALSDERMIGRYANALDDAWQLARMPGDSPRPIDDALLAAASWHLAIDDVKAAGMAGEPYYESHRARLYDAAEYAWGEMGGDQ